jgi:DNA (cytosine-5)-methyltransferase 1
MNALSLFSGIGGMDLAAEAAGIGTVAMCERDPFCRSVLRRYWPDVPIYEDIKKLEGKDIETRIDVIHGGPPCQPVSVAGRRRGKEDERYLWGEVYRIVGDLMPDFLVFENVPGILSIAGDEICKTLDGFGYHIGICQFEAAAVGAPHRRMRVFFVAHSKSGRSQSRAGERNGHFETRREGTDYQAPGSGESSGTVPHPRTEGFAKQCRMREGRPIAGEICQEPGRGQIAYPERPDSLFVPHAESDGRRSRRAEPEGFAREPEPSIGGRSVPNPDSQRREEQQPPLGSVECCGGRFIEPGMGGMAAGAPCWLGGYWMNEPDIPRIAKGVKNRVARLRALGNCVVPAQAYPIFRAIVEAEEKLW